MGNTSAEYYLFAAAPFRERFWDAPRGPDGRALLETCQAECGRGAWSATDVIHDMQDGLTWDLAPALEDAGEDEMAAAWERLWRAMGKDGPPDELPWWVREEFDPEGWYVGLIEPALAVKLQSALDVSGLRERAGELLGARDPAAARTWQRLLELLDRAAADDCWLLAAESMS